VGPFLFEIPLSSIQKCYQCPDAGEPYLAVDLRNQQNELEKFVLFFRDNDWYNGSPRRLTECDSLLSAINDERRKLGFFPEPIRSRGPASSAMSERISGAPGTSDAKAVTQGHPDEPALAEAARIVLGGKYEVGGQIGSGGMGIVYQGQDTSLKRPVAIKKLRSDLELAGSRRDLFMEEARISASLHHPFIVDIYAILEENGCIYLIFEFVEGENLQNLLSSQGPLPAAKAKGVIKCVCEALAFAHSRKVAHRDLKPSNIMLTPQGYAKVMDFGVARQIKETASKLTKGEIAGTWAYMAPEQEVGKFDARSDIFSLGVTIYELITGQLPFSGPNYYAQKEKGMFRPLAQAAADVPVPLARAVDRCLSFDAKARFQTIEDFAQAAGVA
jgi:serine/threonine protein kinase